jgi:hypothetical protein
VVLIYNLIAKDTTALPSLAAMENSISRLRSTLSKWRKTDSPEFLVYALERTYAEGRISASQLAGADIQRVQCLVHLQEELGLELSI